MNFYKGINLDRNKNLYNYINTYHKADTELRDVYMETDTALQRLVNKHYLKRKLLITLYNLSIYGLLYGISILIKG